MFYFNPFPTRLLDRDENIKRIQKSRGQRLYVCIASNIYLWPDIKLFTSGFKLNSSCTAYMAGNVYDYFSPNNIKKLK